MGSRSRTAAAVAAGLIALGACTARTQADSSATASAMESAAPSPRAPSAVAPAAPDAVERARDALAKKGIARDLELISSRPAQWADASLGCPRPGIQYLQVITHGHALRFTGDGRTYEVHVAGDTAVVCSPRATGVPKQVGRAVRVPVLRALVDKARADLATRLGISVEQIRLRDFAPVTWPDANLGCGASGSDASKAVEPGTGVQGFRLFLTAGGDQLYTYHTDSTLAIPCPPIEAE